MEGEFLKVFDNPEAIECLEDLQEDIYLLATMKSAFEYAIETELLIVHDARIILTYAAIIDIVLNDVFYASKTELHLSWIKSLKNINFASITPLAIQALEKTISDNSELNLEYSEDESFYKNWKNDILTLINHLK